MVVRDEMGGLKIVCLGYAVFLVCEFAVEVDPIFMMHELSMLFLLGRV